MSRPSSRAWTRTLGTPSRRASSASATRWRSLAWTPPGPIRLTRWSRPPGRAARRQAARSAGRSKNEPSAIAASMRGRSWRTGRPAPRLRWPTSELPIWPGGSPTAPSDAPSARVRPAREEAAPGRHRGRGDRVGGRVVADPEPVEDDEDDRPRPGRAGLRRHAGDAAGAGGHAGPGHDAGHLVGLERRAADERAVDRGLGQELADVRRGDAAAVQDRDVVRGASASPRSPRRAADRVGHRGGVGAAGVAARADRPDRLVGDDQAGRRQRAPGRGRPSAPRSCASTTSRCPARPRGRELLADAQDRPQAGLDRPAELAADQLVGLAGVPAALGVADDDPRREARRASAPRSRRCRRPASSWWTFWAPTPTSGSGSASASRDGGEAHERRADDAGDARPRGSGRRSSRASSPASAGVVCIFQLRGHDHVTHRRESCQSGRRRGRRPARARRPALVDGRRGRRGARSARGPAGPPTDGASSRSASSLRRRLGRLAPGGGHEPDDVRLRRRGARRPRARRSRRAGGPAALTARWRLADSALRTRFSSPRSARETWRASSSRSAPAAPIRRRNVPTASPLFQVTTPRPRRIRHDAGSPTSARRAASIGASSGSTTNSRWVRPPARLSEPRARNRPRSQAVRQWSAAVVPVERAGPARPCARSSAASAARRTARRATGRLARVDARAGAEPVRLRGPIAGARRVDRGELGAQGRDEVALGAGHVRPASRGPADGAAAHAGLAVERAGSAPRPGGPGRGGGRCPGRRRRRGRGAGPASTAGGQRSRTGSAVPVRRRSGRANAVVGQDDVDEPGRRVRDERLDVGGEVEAGRLAVLGRHVADEDARRAGAPASASRMAGISRLGRRLVYRLPGPRTISSASAMAARASSDGADVVRRQPDALDPGRAHDPRLAVDDRAVAAARVERERRRRDRARPGRGRRGSG